MPTAPGPAHGLAPDLAHERDGPPRRDRPGTIGPRHVALVASFDRSLVNFRGPLIRALRARGVRVSALAPDVSAGVRAELQALGVEVVEYPLARTGTDPFADLRSYRALLRAFRRLQPDAVLAYTAKPIIYGALAAARAGVPSVNALVTGVGNAASAAGPLGVLVRRLYRLALSRARCVVFQNPDDRDEFVAGGLVAAARTTVVDGSGVDTRHYAVVPLPADARFLLLGRLLAEKGIREYVAAARLLRGRGVVASFALAGWQDDHRGAITDGELVAWQAEGVVDYLGPLDDPRPAFADCSVYVLPSYREGTPRTVLEAMSMGRAIVTTDAPGCRETVAEGENGMKVPVRDVGALADAMQRLAGDAALRARMGAASRARVEARYAVERVNLQMLEALGVGG